MHELSIAESLVDAAAGAARGARVLAVSVQVGALAGVAVESLRFCYEVVTRGTPLEGSALRVEELPVVLFCPACGRESARPEPGDWRCDACGAAGLEVRGGRELRLEAIVLDGGEAPE